MLANTLFILHNTGISSTGTTDNNNNKVKRIGYFIKNTTALIFIYHNNNTLKTLDMNKNCTIQHFWLNSQIFFFGFCGMQMSIQPNMLVPYKLNIQHLW